MSSTPSRTSAGPASEASSVKSREPSPFTVAAPDKPQDDSSKLKTFLGILRKFIGVSDIANVRLSLPAQLLEPIPNLEYWHYLDRPETFISIGKSEDGVGRMLEVLRFWFTKDLKYVKGKPCKPYNSTLGEFFRCSWNIADSEPPISEVGSVNGKGTTQVPQKDGKPVKVSYLTEQTSHHPPVSAYFYDCPEMGLSARGYDQISAKFTGTSVRVSPGPHNHGIFINLAKRNEQYQATHPIAYLGGILRGSLYVSVADYCSIACKQTRLKTLLYYVEEAWVGRAQNKVQGVIYKYDPSNDNITRIRDVPEKDVVARIDGSWQDKIYYTLGSQPNPTNLQRKLLIDVNPLHPIAKDCPHPDKQLPNESRRFWGEVTNAIHSKQFSKATKLKQEIEERQREKEAIRQKENVVWKPRFFTGNVASLGQPELTEEGKAVLKGMQEDNHDLKENEIYGA